MRTRLPASWFTSTVRRPSASIFRYPSASSDLISYWHANDPVPPLRISGTFSSNTTGATTTPAACVDSFLFKPSSLLIIMSAFSHVHVDLIVIFADFFVPMNISIAICLFSADSLPVLSIRSTLDLSTVTVVSGNCIACIASKNLASSTTSANSTAGSSGIVALTALITVLGTLAACNTSCITISFDNVPYVIICAT